MGSKAAASIVPLYRWLMVLPGALFTDVLIQSPLDLIIQGTLYIAVLAQISCEDVVGVERAVASLVGMIGYVLAGACIAPTRRLAVSGVLSLLVIVPRGVLLLRAERSLGSVASPLVRDIERTLVLDCVGAVAATCVIVLMRRAERLRVSPQSGKHRLAPVRFTEPGKTRACPWVRARWWAVLRPILLTGGILVLLWWNTVVALPLMWDAWAVCVR